MLNLLVQLTFTSIGWQNRIVLEQAFWLKPMNIPKPNYK
jgi:hypothetical protein